MKKLTPENVSNVKCSMLPPSDENKARFLSVLATLFSVVLAIADGATR